MISGECYIFTPNNIVPDITITKALQGLTVLANEFSKEQSCRQPFH